MSVSVLIRSGFASNLIFFLKVSDLYLWPVGKLQQKYVCLLCVNISGNVCVLSSHLNPHANHWPFQYVACKQLCRSELLKFKVIGIKTSIITPCTPPLTTWTAFVNTQLFSKSVFQFETGFKQFFLLARQKQLQEIEGRGCTRYDSTEPELQLYSTVCSVL